MKFQGKHHVNHTMKLIFNMKPGVKENVIAF